MTPPDPIVIDFSPQVILLARSFYWLAVGTLVLEVARWGTDRLWRNRR